MEFQEVKNTAGGAEVLLNLQSSGDTDPAFAILCGAGYKTSAVELCSSMSTVHKPAAQLREPGKVGNNAREGVPAGTKYRAQLETGAGG